MRQCPGSEETAHARVAASLSGKFSVERPYPLIKRSPLVSHLPDQKLNPWRQRRVFTVEQLLKARRQLRLALRRRKTALQQEAADLGHH